MIATLTWLFTDWHWVGPFVALIIVGGIVEDWIRAARGPRNDK